MMRQTGGRACGATSTRSMSCERAVRRASASGRMPTCSPSGPIRRTSGTRMRSLMRGSRSMLRTSWPFRARRVDGGSAAALAWTLGAEHKRGRCQLAAAIVRPRGAPRSRALRPCGSQGACAAIGSGLRDPAGSRRRPRQVGGVAAPTCRCSHPPTGRPTTATSRPRPRHSSAQPLPCRCPMRARQRAGRGGPGSRPGIQSLSVGEGRGGVGGGVAAGLG